IQTGGRLAMQTLEKVLADLYKDGSISFDAAMSKTSRPDELQRLLEGVGGAAAGNKQAAAAGRRR
ncbi:MAG: twitching motility protein PilT, partial [Cyanobacteria bacterium P01_H01_bin.153]